MPVTTERPQSVQSAVAAPSSLDALGTCLPDRRRWTVAEYQRAAEAGIFGPEERLELINGDIVRKMPPNPPHAQTIPLSHWVLSRAFARQSAHLRTENPIVLSTGAQPEPDIAVVQGDLRRYATAHPTPTDVLLLVEVSDSTLEADRDVKGPMYALAGIREYWIINLRDRQLEVFRSPLNGVWASTFTVPEAGTVAPLAAPQSVVSVADLLP